MKLDSGELIETPDGKTPGPGYIQLTDKEKAQLEHVTPEDRPVMLAWLRYLEAREIHVPIYEKIRMRDAFFSGWKAREKQ